MDDSESLTMEIGKYIETLFRQWRIILLIAIVCVLTAYLVSINQAVTYKASVLIATFKTATEVSLGSGIEILSEEQLPSIRNYDPQTRIESYVKMVDHPTVAQRVLAEIGEQLPEKDRTEADLLRIVSGDIAEKSDLIEITANHNDPDVAVLIANTWGREYVDQINSVYSGGVNQDAYDVIRIQTIEAKENYDNAQESLETRISENQVDQLNRQISEMESLLNGISSNRTFIVTQIVSGTAETLLTVFNEQSNNSRQKLAQLYEQSRNVDQFLKDAESMLDQVKSGGDSSVATNTLALTILKTQVFASNEEMANLQLQIIPTTMSQEQMLIDLDALVKILEDQKQILLDDIEVLSKQVIENSEITDSSTTVDMEGYTAPIFTIAQLNGLEELANYNPADLPMADKVEMLQKQVGELKATLAGEEDQLQELTRARDLAWETYSTLAAKEAELRVALQAKGSEVVVASPALVPKIDRVNTKNRFLLAAVVGLIIGVIAAYFIEFWWSYKGVEPYAITLRSVFKREK